MAKLMEEAKQTLKRLDDAMIRCNKMNMISSMEDIMAGVHTIKDLMQEIDRLKKKVRTKKNDV